ncbi:lipopolysaccharide biosynthesis protein [Enterococcus casseliflavus]|uniref:lipopolysaccharide biosynthesis protein n=1 Tax=Enterococcus casseliflavus TaxID=37734 RepID=UPI0022E983FE|nr:oligosaccharide flippase family protein [Enterococcus casseliflavus]
MKRFLSKLAGFAMGPIIGALISFLTVPITTYFINPSEFGKASMFTVIQSLIVSVIYLGIDQAYTREYNRIESKKKVFQNALIIPLFLSIFFFVGTVIFQKQFSRLLFSDDKYGYISILFGIMIIFSVLERFIILSIRMSERAFEYSVFSISIKLFIFAFTFIIIMIFRRDFLAVVFSTVFGQMFADLILFYRYRDLLKVDTSLFDRELIQGLVKFGLPLIIAASLSNLLNTAGRFFLRGYSTYHDLGIYTAALKISNMLQIIQTAFTSFWVPTAYRWHQEKRDMKNFSFISDCLLLVLTFGFFFILFAKKYIVLILSSEYLDAQYVTGLLALTPILYTLSETSTLGIVFSGKSYYNIWVSVFAIIPNLVLNYLLVPKYGTIGAGIASATAYVAFCFARTYFSRKCGFSINFNKQIIVISIFFIAACLNSFYNTYISYLTGVLFLIAIVIQRETFKNIYEIKKDPSQWDFS